MKKFYINANCNYHFISEINEDTDVNEAVV